MKRSFLRLTFTSFVVAAFAVLLSGQELRITGLASSYPSYFEGKATASGEQYLSTAYTASHASLPFNTVVKVTNLRNNKSVVVRVNDRFPFKTNRVMDVSNAAAKDLDLFGNIAPAVKIEVLEWPTDEANVLEPK